MISLTVTDIMSMSKDKRWLLPDDETIMLTFDDGEEVEVATRPTIMASYYWELPKAFPGMRITKEHHFLDKTYGKDSHIKMSTRVFWDTFFAHNESYLSGEAQKVIWGMTRLIWDIGNEIYNDTISMLGEHAFTIDLDDLLDVITHPEVVALKDAYREGAISIDAEHEEILKVVKGAPELYNNAFNRGFRADLSKPRSFTQTVGSRAFVPDINGLTPETPIYEGYGDGLRTSYDRLTESRTASIALYMQNGPLEDSEYNNRMSQFLCMPITGLHYGDCGGAHALDWEVKERDLPHLAGKVHMVNGAPRVIFGDEVDLIGKTIKLRSITTCDHHNPATPCSVCLGMNAMIAPPNTNLGYFLSTEPLARISQTILSIKHLLATTKLSTLEIRGNDNTWLRVKEDDEQFVYLTKETVKNPTSIRIAKASAPFINDILTVDDVYSLSLDTMTKLEDVQVIVMDKHGTVKETRTVSTKVAGKGSQFTYDFLAYMKHAGWEPVGDSFEVSLEGWNMDDPFLAVPRRGEDVMEVLDIARSFIHSPTKTPYARAIDFKHPTPAIRAFLYGLSDKIFINFSHVEIFVKALMAKGEESYALPKGEEPFRFLRLREAVKNRSPGCAWAFEDQKAMLDTPGTYMLHKDDIPGCHMDHFLK